jgi:hypothetical protein
MTVGNWLHTLDVVRRDGNGGEEQGGDYKRKGVEIGRKSEGICALGIIHALGRENSHSSLPMLSLMPGLLPWVNDRIRVIWGKV